MVDDGGEGGGQRKKNMKEREKARRLRGEGEKIGWCTSVKRKGREVRMELKDIEILSMQQENKGTRTEEIKGKNQWKKGDVCISVSPCRSSAVGQCFASASVYN